MTERPSCNAPERRRRAFGALLLSTVLAISACGEKGPSAAEHLQRAKDFLAQRDDRAAVIELKNALQQDANLAEARLLLGATYVGLGNGLAAVKELEQAQRLGKTGPEVQVLLARAFLLQNDFEKTLFTLAQVDNGDTNPEVLALRGDAQLGLGEVETARRFYELALAQDAGSVIARRGLARVNLGTGNQEEAAHQIQRALDSSSEDLPTWLLKGELELSLNQPEEAQRSFERALAIDAESPAANIGLVRALLAQQKVDEAATRLAPLLQAAPDNPIVNFLAAVLAQQRDDIDTAQNHLREVLRVAPDHGPSQLMLGAIHYTKREFAQALELISRFVTANPGHIPGRKLLAALDLETGQPAEAIALLEPMLSQLSEDAQLLALLGTAYLNSGEAERGRELLSKASELAPDAAAIRTQLALSLLASGADDEAVSQLQSAVSSDPSFARADLLLVLAHIQKREFELAEAAAQELARKQPQSPVPLNLMGAAYEGMQDQAKARDAYEKALELAPGFTAAAMNLARLDLQADDLPAARKRLEDVLAVNDGHPGALVMLARIESNAGDTAAGLELLQRARDRNEKALEPRLILGAYYQRQGDRKNALQMAREAQAIAPDNANVLLLLGRALLAEGNSRDALNTFSHLVERYPNSADAHYQMALAQAQSGDAAATRASLERALELNDRHLLAKATLGEVELRSGNTDAALKIAGELREAFPDAPAGFVLEGDLHLAAGRPDQAVTNYRSALAIAPNGAILIKIAGAQRMTGDEAGAVKTLADWLVEHPQDSSVRLMLASSNHQSGKSDDAVTLYERVLEEQPRNVLALNNLAWLYHERSDPRALTLAEQAYDLVPDRAEIVDTFGWLLVQKGSTERGLTLLERAVKLAPENREIRFHLAAALVKAGDTDRARGELRDLLDSGEEFNGIDEARKLLQEL